MAVNAQRVVSHLTALERQRREIAKRVSSFQEGLRKLHRVVSEEKVEVERLGKVSVSMGETLAQSMSEPLLQELDRQALLRISESLKEWEACLGQYQQQLQRIKERSASEVDKKARDLRGMALQLNRLQIRE